MSTRARTILQAIKAPLNDGKILFITECGKQAKMETQGRRAQKTVKNGRRSNQERKMALIHDVDKLKRKLRHEENVQSVRKGIYETFGSSSSSSSLSPSILLEEEVVRLEEQVVNFRQGLYQEAVYISSERNPENLNDPIDQKSIRSFKHQRSKSLSQSELNSPSMARPKPYLARGASSRKLFSSDIVTGHTGKQLQGKQDSLTSIPEGGRGKENQSFCNSLKDMQSPGKKTVKVIAPVKKSPTKQESAGKWMDHLKLQLEWRLVDQERAESFSSSSDDKASEVHSTPNRVSEDIVKCLCSIFVRIATFKDKLGESQTPTRSTSIFSQCSKEKD